MITKSENLKIESVCEERLQHLADIALDVVESILTDMEAPITLRLEAAFRIFELCNMSPKNNDDVGQSIVKGIEKNANELAYLEALLKAKGANQTYSKTIGIENNASGGDSCPTFL